MNISACIITNNNPDVLKAIESVYDSVSEIVVCITEPQNDFIYDMVKVGGNKINIEWFLWCDDFSAGLNYAISKATKDWILIIDSDEVLSEPIKKVNERFTHYVFNVMNGEYASRSIRLFKNNGKIKYKYRLHPVVDETINTNEGCKVNDIKIIHSGYENPQIVEQKIRRNLRILEKDTDNPLQNYHYCNIYYSLGEYQRAVEYGLSALQDNIEDGFKGIISLQIYASYEKLGAIDLQYLWKSIEFLPNQIFARYKLLSYMCEDKQFNLVLKELNNILTIIRQRSSTLPNDIYPPENFIIKKIKEIEKCQEMVYT